MPSLSTKNYTSAQVTQIKQAFAFLNEGAPATGPQLSIWLDRQIRGTVHQHYSRIESNQADAAATVSVEGF
jgi:hypothetical protein